MKHNGSGAPLKIEHRVGDAMGNVSWDDVTADFDIDAPTGLNGGREIVITRKPAAGLWLKGAHRVVYDRTLGTQSAGNGAAELVCVGVLGEPRMASFMHTIGTYDQCKGGLVGLYDQNFDEELSVLDAGAWMASPTDLNSDAITNSTDMTILLQAIDQYSSLD